MFVNKRMLITIAIMTLLVSGCGGSSGIGSTTKINRFEMSSKFQKTRYQRLALLVSRVGNQRLRSITDIDSEFDYARRAISGKDDPDVYIEEEARLRESLPSYPARPCSFNFMFNNCAFVEDFFGNITLALFNEMEEMLASKGYAVTDLRAFAQKSKKPIGEMKVRDIVASAPPVSDGVLILHYSDVGSSGYKAAGAWSESSFTFLRFAGALFDAKTLERLIWFAGVVPIKDTIANDPTMTKRVKMVSSNNQKILQFDLSTEEITALAIKYLHEGYCEGSEDCQTRSPGLKALIP